MLSQHHTKPTRTGGHRRYAVLACGVGGGVLRSASSRPAEPMIDSAVDFVRLYRPVDYINQTIQRHARPIAIERTERNFGASRYNSVPAIASRGCLRAQTGAAGSVYIVAAFEVTGSMRFKRLSEEPMRRSSRGGGFRARLNQVIPAAGEPPKSAAIIRLPCAE